MSTVIQADLGALQNLIAKFRNSISELEDIDGALRAAFYPFLESFYSTHRPRVEEAFDRLDHYLRRAARLEQGLLHGFETLLTDLQKEEAEQEKS